MPDQSTFIPLRFLQEAIRQAFAKFYPEETAVALAIMHAQMHAKFARSIGQTPVAEGDVRKVIRGNKVAAHFRGHPERLGTGTSLRGERCVDKELVEQELVDCLESLGGNVSAAKLRAELPDLHLSEFACRRFLESLEKKGRIKQVGKGARRVKFFSAVESVGASVEPSF